MGSWGFVRSPTNVAPLTPGGDAVARAFVQGFQGLDLGREAEAAGVFPRVRSGGRRLLPPVCVCSVCSHVLPCRRRGSFRAVAAHPCLHRWASAKWA